MKPRRKVASVSFLEEHLEKLDRLRLKKLETRGTYLGKLIEKVKEDEDNS
jgi:hypothetical protein